MTLVNLSMGNLAFSIELLVFLKIVEYQKLLFLVLPLVSLHNHNDDDENKNIKKGTDLINKTNTLNVQHTFCTFLCGRCTSLTLSNLIAKALQLLV